MNINEKQYLPFKNLQVGDNDLIGNKFNGHDLHLYLRENGIDSSHLVWNKESYDSNTYRIGRNNPDRSIIRKNIDDIKRNYQLNGILGMDAYDILYDELFLNTDVVHYHLLHNLSFDIQLLPILTKLKPTVWTFHDPWVLGGHCVHHFGCNNWENGCEDCPLLNVEFPLKLDNSSLNWELKKLAFQNSRFEIIVASKWMEAQVKKSPLFKHLNVNLIPFGINHSIFYPKNKKVIRDKMRIPNNAKVIVARCHYSEFKGFDYIEYALKNIKHSDGVYVILFDKKIKSKLGNHTYIEYDWIKDDNLLSEIYSASDLVLMPSIVDTFGLTAVEAMSCGALPIVLDGTALPDVVNAPICGVSVKRDKDEYAKTVQYYLDNDKIRLEKIGKCVEFSRKNYNKEIYVKKIIYVYQKAISEHKLDSSSKRLIDQLKKHMLNKGVVKNNLINNRKALLKGEIKINTKRFIDKLLRIWPPYKKSLDLENALNQSLDKLKSLERTIEDINSVEKSKYYDISQKLMDINQELTIIKDKE